MDVCASTNIHYFFPDKALQEMYWFIDTHFDDHFLPSFLSYTKKE